MDNNEEENKHRKLKMVIKIIIIIIIILLLITCCTARKYGRIGDIYKNEGNVDIKEPQKEVITNKDLKFNVVKTEMFVSDENIKLSYYYDNINPQDFSCTTSDSNIATCYVKDGYAVVNPLKKGQVKITLKTEVNGKIYEATTEVNIKSSNKFIKLGSSKGTIDLKGSKTLTVSYRLVNLNGKVKVKIDDENIAKVEIKNGLLVITGKKIGNAQITVSVVVNNKTYSDTYKLKVIDTTSEDKKKDNDSSLKDLTSSLGDLNFKKEDNKYYLSVPFSEDKLSLKALPSSTKSKVSYKFNGKSVNNLQDLELKVGKNVVEIEVEAEDGSVSKYTIEITRSAEVKANNSTLSSLEVSKGTLTPKFKEDVLNYSIEVSNDVDKLDVNFKKKSSKSKTKLKFNDKVVDSLEDLELKVGNNIIEIEVEAEDGAKTTYTVSVERKKNSNNYLKSLEVISPKDLKLNEQFNKNTNNYSMDIPYNNNSLTLKATEEDKKSSVKYKVNGQETSSLEDLKLNYGDNVIEIEVKAEDGSVNTYKVNVHKKKRIIVLENNNYEMYLEEKTLKIAYQVLEDNIKLDAKDYDLNDIEVLLTNYDGLKQIEKEYLVLTPNKSMINKSSKLTLKYADSSSSADIKFLINDYFVLPESNTYELDITDGVGSGHIILQNNLFNSDVEVEELPNGLRIRDKNNPDIYIDIITDEDLKLKGVKGKESLSIEIETNKEGEYQVKIEPSVFGKKLESSTVNVKSSTTFKVTLDANGGFFNEFTTKYEEKVLKNSKFNLNKYLAYKVDDAENCHYYKIYGYSENKNASINDDDVYKINEGILVSKDITLYAIYEETSEYLELEESSIMYLADVDLFHNEEYYNWYKKDKIIYPGAHGSYLMHIDNNSGSDITITNVVLEENGICTNKGCLNMAYQLTYNNTNYLNGDYEILNNGNINASKEVGMEVEIKNGESKDILISWKWAEIDNEVDTSIGNAAIDLNYEYELTVGLKYQKLNKYCNKG